MLTYLLINTVGNFLFYTAGIFTVYIFANKSKPIEIDKPIFHKEPEEVNISDLYPIEEAFVPKGE